MWWGCLHYFKLLMRVPYTLLYSYSLSPLLSPSRPTSYSCSEPFSRYLYSYSLSPLLSPSRPTSYSCSEPFSRFLPFPACPPANITTYQLFLQWFLLQVTTTEEPRFYSVVNRGKPTKTASHHPEQSVLYPLLFPVSYKAVLFK